MHTLVRALLVGFAFAASPAFAFPPFFITTPPTTVAENQPYSYTFGAFDLDFSDTITYGAPILPPFLTFNGVNTISGTPLASHVGTHTVSVTASDGTSTTVQTFALVVTNVDDAPLLVGQIAPDPQHATEDQPYSFNVAPFFMDPDGETLTFSAGDLPARLSIDPSTGVISGMPRGPRRGEQPSYTVTITASNAGGSASDSFILIIHNENDAPVLPEPPPVLSTPEDTPLQITAELLQVQDEDDGDTFTVLVTPPGPNDYFALTNNGTRLQPAADHYGLVQFEVRVRDSAGALSNSVRVTVNVASRNDAPRVREIPAQTATEGTAYSLSLAEYFSDVENDRLTYQATGLPPGLTVDAASGVVSGSPPIGVEARDFTVDVAVSDGTATSSQQFKTSVVRLGRADLVAAAGVAPNPSLLANPATWTLSVQNNSDTDVANVALEALFTGNVPVTFEAPSQASCTVQTAANQTRVSCRFAPVVARSTALVTVAGKVSQTGIVHAATEASIVDRAPIDPVPENNRASATLSIAERLSAGPSQRLVVSDARAVAAADLNGDSFRDLAVATANAGAIAYLSIVDPASPTKRVFAEIPTTLGDAAPGNGIALADLDADGDVDAVTANAAGQTNKVLVNSGTGTFAVVALATNTDASNTAALGDIDGNGRIDIVFANDNQSVVYMNRGPSEFVRAQALGGPDSRDAVLVNLVGDPLPELVLANTDGDATVYRNAAGNLQPPTTLPTGPTTSVAAADLDKDGDADLVFGREAPGGGAAPQDLVFLNTSTTALSFFRSADLLGISTIDVLTADFDFDGDADIMSFSRTGGHRIFVNDGSAHFALYAEQFVHAGASAGVAGLLSIDDRLDVAIAGSTAIGVFVNDRKGNLGAGDGGPPSVQLLGEPNVSLTIGEPYTDLGATATDAIDGDLTAKIVVKNPVNTAVLGTYSVTYDVTDISGNPAPTVTRKVEVKAKTGTGGGGGGAFGLELILILVTLVLVGEARAQRARSLARAHFM